jgi:hypothetical protein
MRHILRLFLLASALLMMARAADAAVQVNVDLSAQRMTVIAPSGETYVWPVSSARAGYVTPNGSYHSISLETMHYSKKYHHSPMPHSIFFHGGYAIHGTYALGSLGRPASHGCIRISPANAAALFALVKAEGATITITGAPPHGTMVAQAHHHKSGSVLAYAPRKHHAPTVKAWQQNPVETPFSLFGF